MLSFRDAVVFVQPRRSGAIQKIENETKYIGNQYKDTPHNITRMTSTAQSPVLDNSIWTPAAFKFMPPKVNDKGGKSINLISTQTGRALATTTPMMNTWGVSDFVDPTTGVSDGKYSISLSFPSEGYTNKSTDSFLEKMKAFEEAVLDAAVLNSDLWWGEPLDKGILKHTFFPTLKYPKVKGTKKSDLTKSPSISAKVPYYEKDNRWNVEIYDVNKNLLFPCENEEITPAHLIPKLSNVACVIQCGGIWIGGKGWGVTWKLVQCVVKPKQVATVFGTCHINLSEDERVAIENGSAEDAEDVPAPSAEPVKKAVSIVKKAVEAPPPPVTQVEDSDDEEPEPVKVEAPVKAPIAVEAPVEAKKIVKKVVAKKA
jgi:hypothetical protein